MRSRHIRVSWFAAIALLWAGVFAVQAQVGTAVTYQGRLTDADEPVNDTADFDFVLYDAVTGGNLVGTATMLAVPVVDGFFNVDLDFGTGVFQGDARWLEITVRLYSTGNSTTLSPRQPIRPAPYALYALDGAGGSSDSYWLDHTNGIYYSAGNVGIGGMPGPAQSLNVRAGDGETALSAYSSETGASTTIAAASDVAGGRALSGEAFGSGTTYGVHGFVESPAGFGVYGDNQGNSGDAIGVYGNSASPDGFGGYFQGKGYFSGNVGIGTTSPAYPLHVAGDAGFNADAWFCSPAPFEIAHQNNTGMVIDPVNLRLQLEVDGTRMLTATDSAVGIGTDAPSSPLTVAGLVESTANGFKFPDGTIQSTAATGGGSSLWSQNGSDIYYDGGNVGVGTSTPDSRFHVVDPLSFAITAECVGEGTIGLLGGESAGVEGHGPYFGVLGQTTSTTGAGVKGQATGTSGVNKGVWGQTSSSGGCGVYGSTAVDTGTPVGVFGETSSPDGYGVRGYNDADSGNFTAVGVYGSTNAPRGVGIKGYAPGANGGYGVWGQAAGPSGRGVFAESLAETGNTIGVEAYVACPTGKAVYGFNEATTGDAIAVYGDTASPDGFGGYFTGKGYFSGNVGIGTTTPASPLTVAGLVESTLDGFKFPDGTIQTTAATGGGSSLWSQNGSDIYYNNGDVGIGTANPDSQFVVEKHYDNNIVPMAIFRTTGTNAAGAIRFENGAGNEFNFGITANNELALGYNANIALPGDLLRITSTGNVGIGTTSPDYRLHVYAGADAAVAGENPGENTRGELGSTYGGVFGESTTGTGVHGRSTAESGTNYGVRGECASPAGYAGYFDGRGYFSGNVGIGRTNPTERLHVQGNVRVEGASLSMGQEGTDATIVLYSDQAADSTEMHIKSLDSVGLSVTDSADQNLFVVTQGGRVGIGNTSPTQALDVSGTVKMTGVQVGNSATPGHVLTADASGVGTWQESTGSQWEGSGGGSDIYYMGQVGIGTTNPQFRLQVESSDSATIRVKNTSTYGEFCGVLAEIDSPDGRALKGYAASLTGDAAGVFGQSASPDGYGVYGRNLVGGYGIYGEGDTGSGGWAGYFSGRGYFSGDVGVGRAAPEAKLDVNGTVKMNGFRLGASSTSGYVLTCDANGVGTWQESTGGGSFDLPYSGSVSSTTAALSITNTGTGAGSHAIAAVINNPSSSGDAAAAYFNATGSNGRAVYAQSDAGATIHAYHTGPNYAYYGSSSGVGGAYIRCSSVDGYGVKGIASADTGFDTVGGWFESDSSVGKGVLSLATGAAGTAIVGEASGSLGVGISAKNASTSEPALLARNDVGGPLIAAKNSATTTVFEVANDGTTSVSVLQITGGADLAEKFDVSEQVEPGMVVEIDPDNPGKLRIARGEYSRRVAGVVSGANELGVGMVLGELRGAQNATPIALSGRVWVCCDASERAIEPGDMLTTSDLPGHAMPVLDHARAHGAVIGKAMGRLAQGETGLVLVLVNLQ